MKQFKIVHQDREYAKTMGDPTLTVVTAKNKQEAEETVRKRGIHGLSGILAVEIETYGY